MSVERNLPIDGMKFIAAAGIVLLHVAIAIRSLYPGIAWPEFVVQLMNWPLFFFFAVAGYFHGPLGNRGGSWLGARVLRLAIPYAAWSLVYLAWTAGGRFAAQGPNVAPDLIRLIFFAGAKDVLWSLPMLAYAAAFAELVVRSATARRWAIAAALLSMAAFFWFVPSAHWPQDSMVYFVLAPRWLLLYLVGMEVRSMPVTASARPAVYYAVFLAGAAYIVAGVGGLFALSNEAVALTLFSIVNVVMAVAVLRAGSLNVSMLGSRRLAWGGKYLLGVYVSHYLWLEVWFILARRIGASAEMSIALGWCFCFGLALLTTMLVSRIPFLRATVS